MPSLTSWLLILLFCRSLIITLALNNNYNYNDHDDNNNYIYNNNNNNNNYNNNNNNNNNKSNIYFNINYNNMKNDIYNKFHHNNYYNKNTKNIDNVNQYDNVTADITASVYDNSITIYNNIPDYERQVLYDIYYTMNGKYWNWHDEYYYGKKWNFTNSTVNPCELNNRWQGINCTSMNSSSSSSLYNYNIIKINLTHNNVIGKLPNSISNLTYLNEIIFDYNHITGTIPYTIDKLTNLIIFSFINNSIIGNLPCFLFNNLTKLEMIAFNYNSLTGRICEINHNVISNLRIIQVSFNHLTGYIPSSFYYLNNLILCYMNNNLLSGTLPLFSFNNNIEVLSLHNNDLTGTIPYHYGNYNKLIYFYISDNYLTGTLPISFQKLNKLQIFIINNNMLSGKLDYCFNSTNQISLRTIDISNNQFSGYIPEELYKMKKLYTIAAVSNCFELSISSSICLSLSLESIIFDGLQTSSACRTYLFSKSSSLFSANAAYEISSPFQGQLPTCIFNMSTLLLFHFSGNGLSGSIPNDIVIHPSMYDLSLSHNRLTGSIPHEMQSHEWLRLDLSKNYFNGKLNHNFNSNFFNITKYFIQRSFQKSYENSSFGFIQKFYSLSGNRLSGNIPNYFLHQDDVNILFGNSFSCQYNQRDLPRHDQNEYGYSCGSNTFNVIYFLWLSCSFLLLFIIIISCYNYKYNNNKNKNNNTYFQYIKSKIQQLPSIQVKSHLSNKYLMLKLQNYTDYFQQYQEINVYILYFLCFIIIIFLPMYLILNIFYKTHEYKYAYVVSIMYLSGEVPAYLLLIIFFIFQVFIRYCVINYVTNNPYFNKKNDGDNDNINNDRNDDNNNDNYTYNSDGNNNNNNYGYNNDNKDNVNTTISSNVERNSFHVDIRPSAITLYELNKQVLLLKNIKINFYKIIYLYICIFIINFIIVLGVNIAFVYITLYQSYTLTTIAQIFQSIFELIWDFCLPILINFFCLKIWNISIYSKEHDLRDVWSKITLLLLFLILFNTIVIPCLVVAIVSPNCFYDLIISTSSVTSTFPFVDCIAFNIYGICQQFDVHLSTTSYDPPFNYSYQCSDDLIAYYAPSEMYSCFILSFLYPLSIIMTIYINKHYPDNSLLVKLVRLYYPSPIYRTLYNDHNNNNNINDQSQHDEHYHLIYEANLEIIYFLQMIGTMLTFGLVFPLIAITIFFAIIILWLTSKYLCDRFLLNLILINNIIKIESFNLECYGIINQIMIENSFWLISIFSSCFFSFFLYDILGDKNGYQNSYWIIIITSLIPCYIYIIEIIFKYSYKYFIKYRNKIFICRQQQDKQQQQQDTQEQQQQQQEQQQRNDMIEMTEVKSPLAISEESI